jgi:hypothetical protein
MLSGVMLNEKSSAACAVISWNDQLYVTWTGTDLFLNIVSSPNWGVFADKRRLPHRSYKKITTSSSNMSSSGTSSARTSSSTTTTVALPPSMAGSGERLYLAWRGGDRALNLQAVEPGADATPAKVRERSTESPSLTTYEYRSLMLAWAGTDRHVNLAKVTEDSLGASIRLEQAKIRLEEARSSHAPAVCSHRGGLVLAWTGTDRRVNLLTRAEDLSRAPIRLEEAKSSHAPAVCSHRGGLVLAWTGTDRRPNLGRVQ